MIDSGAAESCCNPVRCVLRRLSEGATGGGSLLVESCDSGCARASGYCLRHGWATFALGLPGRANLG